MITQKIFISDYNELSVLEKAVLQILSIAYVPVNQTQLIDCLKESVIKAGNGHDFNKGKRNDNFKALRPTLDRLLSQKWFWHKSNRSNLVVNPYVMELLTRQSIKEKTFDTYVQIVKSIIFNWTDKSPDSTYIEEEDLIAVIRIVFYRKDFESINDLYSQYKIIANPAPTLTYLCENIACNPFDPEWFEILPSEIRTPILKAPLIRDIIQWTHINGYNDYLEQLLMSDSSLCDETLKVLLLEKWIIRKEDKKARQWLEKYPDKEDANILALKGWLAFSEGKNEQAIKYYESGLELLNSSTKRRVYFNTFSGIFFILALLKTNTNQSLNQAEYYLTIAVRKTYLFHNTYKMLKHPLFLLSGKSKEAKSVFDNRLYVYSGPYPYDNEDRIELFFQCFAFYWVDKTDKTEIKANCSEIKKLSNTAKKNGYTWFHDELECLLKASTAKKIPQKCENSALLSVIDKSNVWEQTLNSLLALKRPATNSSKGSSPGSGFSDLRMVWFLTHRENGECEASPREQKRNAKGKWSKGRPIALKKLYESLSQYPYISQQDREILSNLYEHNYKDGWYTNTEYIFDDKYIFPLVGHPLIFLEDGQTKIELTKGKPELLVSQQKAGTLRLYLSPPPAKYKDDYMAVKESQTRIKLVKLDDEYHRIADILGQGITVPALAKERVQQIIENFATDILIVSDIEGESSQIKEVKADSKIHMHLLPAGSGLKFSMFVRPVKGGAYYSPGTGGKMVISEIQGTQMQTVRDLDQEKKEAEDLFSNCPGLQLMAPDFGECVLDEPSDCLQALLELETLEDKIVLEWPEGVKFKLSAKASLKQFQLNIKKQQDWFAATGKVQLDEKSVLDMQKLMELIDTSPGPFLEIKQGEFIALTQEFYKRLQELKRYSEKHEKGVRFHPLAALALEGLTHEAGKLKTDKAWKDHVQKLNIGDEEIFPVPSTLQADLRDYQIEGVQWLARLADWQVGACLADDMGLGKTLQALAILLKYAPSGPSLIIAPTSVCMNWLAEAKRFAPTLNLVQFESSHRQELLNSLKKFDVLVCSYGLLQQSEVAEILSKVTWQMIVLDEAQAIKNIMTKRSQAAMNLKAGFKLIMTGTPIENHMGELWNLFNFINPGLLGSFDKFNLKYIQPIERNKDAHARQHLKKLIQPFILRRTKNKVLEELPSRTEIKLDVELSKEEMAFYEALRRQAIKSLSEEQEKGGEKHLKILAEIMKLRRACCNPQLVHPDIRLSSSKLEVFGSVLEELLENKHKALVFSQFVGHLTLIRAYLDEKQISYQYLDGSTSQKKRQIAVDSFQAGEGDVFLISLKAGGFGLNLTAADYVIHMDPWWNPAVEDQASDRAHRIGQQRPVTIYRLIAKNTIEEKIVEMHNKKRDLADSLLEGSDVSAKLSSKDLLALIGS